MTGSSNSSTTQMVINIGDRKIATSFGVSVNIHIRPCLLGFQLSHFISGNKYYCDCNDVIKHSSIPTNCSLFNNYESDQVVIGLDIYTNITAL